MPEIPDFERVVLPHLDAAHNLARWLVRDPGLAQDVVQDAAVRAISAYPGYRGGDARAWWLRIVRNVAYDMLAARRRMAGVPVDEALADTAATPEAALGQRKSHAELDRTLAALPPELREALVLRELEGLSYKEIAVVTGVPVGTVMSRLWRARQALLRTRAGGER